jgi:hypothetical protein
MSLLALQAPPGFGFNGAGDQQADRDPRRYCRRQGQAQINPMPGSFNAQVGGPLSGQPGKHLLT